MIGKYVCFLTAITIDLYCECVSHCYTGRSQQYHYVTHNIWHVFNPQLQHFCLVFSYHPQWTNNVIKVILQQVSSITNSQRTKQHIGDANHSTTTGRSKRPLVPFHNGSSQHQWTFYLRIHYSVYILVFKQDAVQWKPWGVKTEVSERTKSTCANNKRIWTHIFTWFIMVPVLWIFL